MWKLHLLFSYTVHSIFNFLFLAEMCFCALTGYDDENWEEWEFSSDESMQNGIWNEIIWNGKFRDAIGYPWMMNCIFVILFYVT